MSKTPEYRRAQYKRYRDLQKQLDYGWNPQLEQALREFQPACVLCGREDNLSVDHVYPLSKGYGLDVGNAVILCRSCNSQKHDKDPEELSSGLRETLLAAANAFYDHMYGPLDLSFLQEL